MTAVPSICCEEIKGLATTAGAKLGKLTVVASSGSRETSDELDLMQMRGVLLRS